MSNKNKKWKIKIDPEKLEKISRAASRNAELELGLRRPTHKIHKNKKAYTRKIKHKK